MQKKKTNRKWRVNLVILYNNSKIAEINRSDILNFLIKFSSIYQLDYAISENHEFNNETETGNLLNQRESDIFYFRSNQNTKINSKELRTTIKSLFPYSFFNYYQGVEFFTQLNKFLREYPFPEAFFRPLRFPYIEKHDGSKNEVLVEYDEIMKLIEKEQNFPLN